MANRLASETSPYLLQHADNPVDWYPWCGEALQQATAQDKPIFLSVGYAACHWCHVMAHESFENALVAEYMNEHYINIKVDREERPDIDSIYMDAVVALTGQGGWPMSVFLTPEGEPFFGGTYFPPERRFNRPSFLELLEEIQRLWTEDRDRLLEIGADLTSRLRQKDSGANSSELLQPAMLKLAAKTLFENYDWRSGGWGAAPKFPQPAAIEFLLRHHRREGDSLALDMARHALDAMAGSGLYDQLGGGFHRYSVDAGWRVPHFEKMLYDNAGLMRAYLHGWQLTGEMRYLEVVEGIYTFLQAEMHDTSGGYYASLDADSEGEEGRFYTWTLPEVQRVLDDERLTSIASAVYGIHPDGNFEGTNVLSSLVPLERVAREHDSSLEQIQDDVALIRDRLLDARSKRVRPATDDKVLSAWNGLLLMTLAETAFATQRADVLKSSQALASFLLDQMVVAGEIMRSWRRGKANVPGFLEDYAAVGLGLLSLYQVDFNPRWLQEARSFARTILDRFSDPAGGFFDTPSDQDDLIIRPKSIQDSPFPSGNSMAAMLLLQLHALDGNMELHQAATSAMISPAAHAATYPGAFAGWLSDIEFALGAPVQLALIGDPGSSHFQELLAVAARGYYPQMVRAGGPPDDTGAPAVLEGRVMKNDRATAYLCRNFSCRLPTDDVEMLAQQIEAAFAGGRE